MADIDILVDSTQVKTAKQEIAELGNSFNSAAKSASIFMQAFQKAAAQSARDAQYLRDVARANQEIINTNLKVSNSYKSAESSALAMIDGLRQQEAQALKTARANQEMINAQLGVGGPSATSGGASFSAMEAEINSLATRYNSLYAASQLYEKELASIQRANQLGVISTKQYEAELERLNLEYQQYANSSEGAAIAGNRFAAHVNATRSGLNNFGVVAQQVGYQVGDFFVQIQSGTNAFVAFGQQATQLAGLIPGIGGAIAGIGISVATAFLSFSTRTQEAVESAKEFKTVLDDISAATQNLTLQRLSPGFNLDSQKAAVTQQIAQLETQIYLLKRDQVEQDGFSIAESNKQILALQNQVNSLRSKLALYEQEKKKLEEAKQKAEELDLAFKKYIGSLITAARIDLGNIFDVAKGKLGDLSSAASDFLKKLEAIAYINYNQRGNTGYLIDQYSLYGAGQQDMQDAGPLYTPYPVPEDDKGGSAAASNLQSLIESLQYQREALTAWYEESKTLLQSASDQELEVLGGKYEAMARLDAEYRQKIYEAQQAQSQMSFQAYAGMFSALGELLSVFAGKSKGAAVAALAIQKGLAIAQIITSTAAAQMRAYAELGPIAGAAMAAKIGLLGKMQMALVAATGIAQAGQIMSGGDTGSTGGGSSGSGPKGSASVSTTTTTSAAQTVYISGLDPNALFTGEQLANLFDSFYKENDNRGKVFVVAR